MDLAILDLQMPGMDGCHLAREIHSIEKFKELPLILLSSSIPSKSIGISAVDEFIVRLMKPIKQSELFDAFTTALGKIKTITKSLRQSKPFDPSMATRLPFKILVVEDNIINQKVSLRVLEQFGYQADLAASGRKQWKPWNAKSTISSSWTSKCRRWMVSKPPASFAPPSPSERPYIVVMTANAMKEDRELCPAAGMNDYVSKPIRPDEIKSAIERAAKARPTAEKHGSDHILN